MHGTIASGHNLVLAPYVGLEPPIIAAGEQWGILKDPPTAALVWPGLQSFVQAHHCVFSKEAHGL